MFAPAAADHENIHGSGGSRIVQSIISARQRAKFRWRTQAKRKLGSGTISGSFRAERSGVEESRAVLQVGVSQVATFSCSRDQPRKLSGSTKRLAGPSIVRTFAAQTKPPATMTSRAIAKFGEGNLSTSLKCPSIPSPCRATRKCDCTTARSHCVESSINLDAPSWTPARENDVLEKERYPPTDIIPSRSVLPPGPVQIHESQTDPFSLMR